MSLHLYSGVTVAAVIVKRGSREGRTQSRGRGGDLARSVNKHGHARGCRTDVAAKDLLPLPNLCPVLCEGFAIGMQQGSSWFPASVPFGRPWPIPNARA